MNKKLTLLILSVFWLSISCQSQSKPQEGLHTIKPGEYSSKIKELDNEVLLDVRTPGEYESGHLAGARNIDWNGGDFEQQVAKLDKDKPVMVYCQAGGRSAAAAAKLQSMGFTTVYNMDGGIGLWKQEGLEVGHDKPELANMSMQDYEQMVTSDKLVLVDFYTTWCKPCKMMDPHLKAIAKENKDIDIIKVDAEKNETVSRQLNIGAIPSLMLYKNGKMVWNYVGYISKEELSQKISTFK